MNTREAETDGSQWLALQTFVDDVAGLGFRVQGLGFRV